MSTASTTRKNEGTPRNATAAGFSIVEVLVSAFFVALSVIAVVSAVTTGARLQVTDNDRRQVRALIQSVLEERYDFRNYPYITPGTISETVTIDERGGNPLIGTLSTTILDVTPSTDNNTAIPAREITLTCRWNVDPRTVDSITLTKIVAQVQR